MEPPILMMIGRLNAVQSFLHSAGLKTSLRMTWTLMRIIFPVVSLETHQVSVHCPASLLIDCLRVQLWLTVCVCHLDLKYSFEMSVGLFDDHCMTGPI